AVSCLGRLTRRYLERSVSFCYRRGWPRDVHSFPARRSSDLDLCERITGSDALSPADRYMCDTPRRLGGQPHPGDDTHAPARHEVDRKSTRLNSSHVKISYAVFCLKKKKMRNNL